MVKKKRDKDKKPKEPKAPKKKLSKKEKLRLAAEQAEQQRIEQEKERQRLIQEEKARVERERLAAEEKAKRDVAEQSVRIIQIKETLEVFRKLEEKMNELKIQKRANEEWQQYLKCDGLPDPASLSEMNTYLYLWRSVEERGQLDDVVKKTTEILGLLGAMQELIDTPLNITADHVESWKQVRNDVRVEQQINLNRATYLILRNIQKKMELEGLNLVRYVKKFDDFILCLWSLMELPKPYVPLTKTERTPLACDFEDVGVSVSLPDSLFDVLLVVRAMLVKYDHLSDLCPSWVSKPLPEEEKRELYETSLVEWDVKCELQKLVDEENDRRAKLAAKVAAMKPTSSSTDDPRRAKNSSKEGRPQSQTSQQEMDILELQQIQQTPVKTASEMYAEKEDELQAAVKLQFQIELQTHELDLRKYIILGGVYHIDLLQQPPQPQELHNGFVITVLEIPTELLPVDFHEKYVPPPPPEPGQRRLPEEIEAELKKQEQELEKLALTSIESLNGKKEKKGEKADKKEKEKKKGKKANKKERKKKEKVEKGEEKVIKVENLDNLPVAEMPIASSLLLMVGKKESKETEYKEDIVTEPTLDPELEKLAIVEIQLPGNVLWFEPPIVAGWDNSAGIWSTEDFHDLKFNEDKQVLTFRTGRFGAIGLAAFRYANLPYQTWELKPYNRGEGVCFNITAAVMIVEFIIKGDKVCVNQLQNGATEALQEIVGKYYSPYQLRKVNSLERLPTVQQGSAVRVTLLTSIKGDAGNVFLAVEGRLLCNGGVDLFPPHDAYCYIDGAIPKHKATENHLYHCMALLSTSHSFSWSRWNFLAGRRNLIIQMREFADKKRQPDYSLLLVTPQKTCIVDCTEMSQSFSDDAIQGSKFCSDLYHLVMDRGTFTAISKVNEIPFTLAETVFEMLSTTRIISFS